MRFISKTTLDSFQAFYAFLVLAYIDNQTNCINLSSEQSILHKINFSLQKNVMNFFINLLVDLLSQGSGYSAPHGVVYLFWLLVIVHHIGAMQ